MPVNLRPRQGRGKDDEPDDCEDGTCVSCEGNVCTTCRKGRCTTTTTLITQSPDVQTWTSSPAATNQIIAGSTKRGDLSAKGIVGLIIGLLILICLIILFLLRRRGKREHSLPPTPTRSLSPETEMGHAGTRGAASFSPFHIRTGSHHPESEVLGWDPSIRRSRTTASHAHTDASFAPGHVRTRSHPESNDFLGRSATIPPRSGTIITYADPTAPLAPAHVRTRPRSESNDLLDRNSIIRRSGNTMPHADPADFLSLAHVPTRPRSDSEGFLGRNATIRRSGTIMSHSDHTAPLAPSHNRIRRRPESDGFLEQNANLRRNATITSLASNDPSSWTYEDASAEVTSSSNRLFPLPEESSQQRLQRASTVGSHSLGLTIQKPLPEAPLSEIHREMAVYQKALERDASKSDVHQPRGNRGGTPADDFDDPPPYSD